MDNRGQQSRKQGQNQGHIHTSDPANIGPHLRNSQKPQIWRQVRFPPDLPSGFWYCLMTKAAKITTCRGGKTLQPGQ